MPDAGFLGARADALVDTAIVFFIAAPFLMAYGLRLARQRRYRSHRKLQLAVLLSGIVAIVLLEVSIRYGAAADAFQESSLHGHPTVTWLFVGHLVVAFPTFVSWCSLAIASARRCTRDLPGSFSSKHRRWGTLTYVGVWLTCITGTGLYVIGFIL